MAGRRRHLERVLVDERDPERRNIIRRELEGLEALAEALDAIQPADFAKYQALLSAIRDGEPFRWNARRRSDRLVVFSERIATLRWLKERMNR